MTKTTYTTNTIQEIESIGLALHDYYKNNKCSLRTISKISSLSVNTVKAVLNGETGNIASYSAVASAMGTTLLDIVKSMSPVTTPAQEPTTV